MTLVLINTLELNGVFDRCKGVVLGEFTDCGANLDFTSVEELICSYLKDYGIPVCCGFPVGSNSCLPLIEGAPCSLDVTAEQTTLTFNIEGTSQPVEIKETSSLFK